MKHALPEEWKKPDNPKLESRELVNHDDLIETPSLFACVVKLEWSFDIGEQFPRAERGESRGEHPLALW